MDILGALTETATSPSGRCKLGRWLDAIDDDTAGKTDLVATIETTDPQSADYRTLVQVTLVLFRLGLPTSDKTVQLHRTRVCRCAA